MPSLRPSASAVCGPADFSACSTRREPRCFMAVTLARLQKFGKYLLFRLCRAKRDGLNTSDVTHASRFAAASDLVDPSSAPAELPAAGAAAQERQARSLRAAAVSPARHRIRDLPL